MPIFRRMMIPAIKKSPSSPGCMFDAREVIGVEDHFANGGPTGMSVVILRSGATIITNEPLLDVVERVDAAIEGRVDDDS